MGGPPSLYETHQRPKSTFVNTEWIGNAGGRGAAFHIHAGVGASFRSDGMEADECAVCPSCLDCAAVGKTMLKSGWAFFGAKGKAYRCPGANKFEACPALELNQNASMDTSTCALGYEGPVCGNCQSEYNHLKVGNPCDPCDDGVINVPLVMGLFFGAMVVGGAVISGCTHVLGVLQDNGVITDLRILVGFYQILGQASNVLDLVFPYPVPELVGFIKLLFLDVRRVVMLDCWDIGGFYEGSPGCTTVFVHDSHLSRLTPCAAHCSQ
eukprot:COSAG04_NODE_88_length_27314_cov_6.056476_9_plen_267_part_00